MIKEAEYIGESEGFFTNGVTYKLFADGDGYHEPFTIMTRDDNGDAHIVAYHSTEDEWFKKHFREVVEDEQIRNDD